MFGELHAALIGLSARLCGGENWIAHVDPSNDAERDESLVQGISLSTVRRSSADLARVGHSGTVSVFAEKVETMAEALQGSLLSYLSIATRKRVDTNVFKAIYTPSFHTDQGSGE